MSRQVHILEILEKRHPLSKKIDEVRGQIQDLLAALTGLDRLNQEFKRLNNSPEDSYAEISSEQIADKPILVSQLESLRYLHERLSKPPLKIAIAGLPKQGKSTLIRAITGLNDKVIPSSKFLCTGSSYTIRNHEEDQTYALIQFYSRDDFLREVILPYYRDPNLNLSNEPKSLDSWEKPSSQSVKKDAVSETKFERLLDYYQFYSCYQTYLTEQRQRVEQAEIRKYISQVDENEQKIHVYRAVKAAEIFTRFPNEDVGQIALVDTPGVGELRIKEDENLVETLRKSADVVVCVICPTSNAYTYQAPHTEFFRLMQEGIGRAEERCLLVLNDDGQNSEACRELCKPERLEQWGLRFARVFVANCSQVEEVGKRVVDPTLDYLAEKIGSLDLDDVKASFDIIFNQSKLALSILEKLSAEPASSLQYISSRKYREIFDKSFTPNLRNALKTMRVNFTHESGDLSVQSVVQKRLESFSLYVPSVEQIESRRDPKDTYEPVFEAALGQLRAQAIKHFQGLDSEFKPVSDKLKKIVVCELKKIGLEKLSSKDGDEFLKAIYDLLPETCKMLRLAFQVLHEFELAYFWAIRVKIYQGLDPLLPEKNTFKPRSNNPAKPITAETIHLALKESCVSAKGKLLGMLGGKAADDLFPSSVVAAVLEEFIDLAFYSSDDEGRSVVLGEWQDFLEPHKAKIWVEIFEDLEKDVLFREGFLKVVEQAKTATTKLLQTCDIGAYDV